MDCAKIGRLIAALRKEKGLTQQELADGLGISNKTVSKWECGLGCPDLTLWNDLAVILGVDTRDLMEGEIRKKLPDPGNLGRLRFYVCPHCGNILFSTSGASLSCCGHRLEPLKPSDVPCPTVNAAQIDLDWYITVDHPMQKNHYLSFAAYVRTDTIVLKRLYPEQDAAFRLPDLRGGTLYLYCTKDGLHRRDGKF